MSLEEALEQYPWMKRDLAVCTHKNEKFLKNFNEVEGDQLVTKGAVVWESPVDLEIYAALTKGFDNLFG